MSSDNDAGERQQQPYVFDSRLTADGHAKGKNNEKYLHTRNNWRGQEDGMRKHALA